MLCPNYDFLLYFQIDLNNDESISFSELGDALAMCGIKIPNWEVRKIIESIDANKDGKVSLDEFKNVS